tara:strand:- start:838 stop:1077 length:240 start_codon:yes stop_codon:yes gene_type:complete
MRMTCRFVWIILLVDLVFAGVGVQKKRGMSFVGFSMQDELLVGSDLHGVARFRRAKLGTGLSEVMVVGKEGPVVPPDTT